MLAASGLTVSRTSPVARHPGPSRLLRPKLTKRPILVRADGSQDGSGRQPWDAMRFLKTVAYFNEFPTPDKVLAGIVKKLTPVPQADSGAVVPLDLPQQSPSSFPVGAAAAGAGVVGQEADELSCLTGVVMVTGATGGVGRRVVARLLAAGKHVRALVRDVDKARSMLSSLPVGPGARLELAAADITQRQTLLSEMFEGVRALVCCSAVKVAPREGDTPDRAKYYQGIKFYDPEVVGDTPEAVEYIGMLNLLDAAAETLGLEAGVTLLHPSGDSAARWGALDDVVMGGVSSSGLQLQAGEGEGGDAAWVFSGNVSTDNFGGFASVRTRNLDPPLDLSPYEGIALRLKGDGQRYKFILRPDANWDGIAYCTSFDTAPAGEWQTVRLPFSAFFPVFRAKRLPEGKPLDPSAISSIQIMLSKFEYDGQLNPSFTPGPFSLPLSYISSYLPGDVAPRFVLVSSAGVTRPNRPGINPDQEPPAVKMNEALGGILTWKLAGEDALRASGVPYAIVRPTALTEEPGGMPVEVDQGDTVKGKISREDVADLCVALLACGGPPTAGGPTAGATITDTTFEVRSTLPFSQTWTGVANTEPGGSTTTATTTTAGGAATPGSAPSFTSPAGAAAAAAAGHSTTTAVVPRRRPFHRSVSEWRGTLAAAGLRRGVTGRTVEGVYTGRQTEEEALEAAGITPATATATEPKPAATTTA